ncbi:MAG: MFS transporter [Pseudomonadota bacterium]
MTERVSWREVLNRRYAAPLALVCLSIWLHAADGLLVATMMPSIVSDIGGAALISWTVMLYEVGSIVAGAAGGLAVLRFGLHRSMIFNGTVYCVGCVLSAIAPEMWVMLVGRALQGLGGGGLIAQSFVAVTRLFPKRLTPRVMAAVSTLWGTSAFCGPLIGGLFVEFGDWRGGFWFFAAQALLLILFIKAHAQNQKGLGEAARLSSEMAGRLPGFRLTLLASGVIMIAYAGIEVSPILTPLLLMTGFLSLGLFLHLDGKQNDTRLLPRRPFGFSSPESGAFTMILCFCAATIAITVYGPILMTYRHGASALVAGYITACSSIGWSFGAIAVSGAPERHDRTFILGGMTLLMLSILGFVYAIPQGPLWLIAVFALFEGIGFGVSWAFILRRLTAVAPAAESERIAAAIPTVQRFGYALGAAYAGIVANGAGLERDLPAVEAGQVGAAIFLACLPIGLIGLAAAIRFVWRD